MKSLYLGKIFDIKAELHWSFVILSLFVIGLFAFTQPANLLPVAMAFFFLFLSVFLHELAHSVVSLWRGIKVKKIVLLPIGGVSITDSLPEKPLDEFLIAIAGPALNFAVVLSIILLVSFVPMPFETELLKDMSSSLSSSEALLTALLSMPLFAILWWNLLLGSFNLLIPALPLDGGRVLRSLLAFPLGRVKATRIATKISRLIAILMFILGFLAINFVLMIIALFVFFGSREEEKIVLMKEALKGKKIQKLIEKAPLFNGSISLGKAVQEMIKKRKGFAVAELQKGKYGILSIDELQEHISKSQKPLNEVLHETKPLPLTADAGKAIEKILTTGEKAIPVTRGKTLVGIITARELQRAVIIARSEKALKVRSI